MCNILPARLQREWHRRISERVPLAVDGAQRDPEVAWILLGQLRNVVGDLSVPFSLLNRVGSSLKHFKHLLGAAHSSADLSFYSLYTAASVSNPKHPPFMHDLICNVIFKMNRKRKIENKQKMARLVIF